LIALIAGITLALTFPAEAPAQTLTALHSFTKATYTGTVSTNSDGAFPNRMLLSGNTLFETTTGGNTNGNGTVFAINTDGSGFTMLHIFSAAATNALGHYTNSDGTSPYAGLILAGNRLYGTADQGGTNGTGAVFAIDANGSNFVGAPSPHCWTLPFAISII